MQRSVLGAWAPLFGSYSGCCRAIAVLQPASRADPLVIFKITLLKSEVLCCVEYVRQVREKQSIWINAFQGTRRSRVFSPCSVPGRAADLTTHRDNSPRKKVFLFNQNTDFTLKPEFWLR